ncbi:MAG TPA: hypothetical protein VF950_14515 [Planctomycetota bacterium]
MSEKPAAIPKHLFGPLWSARSLTRVLPVPDWVTPAHIPFLAIPRERRLTSVAKSDRVFWKSAEAAGVCVRPEEAAWTLDGLRGIQLYADTTDGGWVELRLLWTSIPDWATLVVHEPWDAATRARFAELGMSLAKFLSISFEA